MGRPACLPLGCVHGFCWLPIGFLKAEATWRLPAAGLARSCSRRRWHSCPRCSGNKACTLRSVHLHWRWHAPCELAAVCCARCARCAGMWKRYGELMCHEEVMKAVRPQQVGTARAACAACTRSTARWGSKTSSRLPAVWRPKAAGSVPKPGSSIVLSRLCSSRPGCAWPSRQSALRANAIPCNDAMRWRWRAPHPLPGPHGPHA